MGNAQKGSSHVVPVDSAPGAPKRAFDDPSELGEEERKASGSGTRTIRDGGSTVLNPRGRARTSSEEATFTRAEITRALERVSAAAGMFEGMQAPLASILRRDREEETRKRRENQALRMEVDRLRTQIDALTSGGGLAMAEALTATPTLADGRKVAMSRADVQHVRSIFDMFDLDNSGGINHSELKNLHAKLGEPLTDTEVRTAMLTMSPHGGEIKFDDFLRWWNEMNVNGTFGDRKGVRYAARFKFLRAKLRNIKCASVYTKEDGEVGTPEYRVRFFTTGPMGEEEQCSPWHDIPLHNSNGTYNFICEIPKWSRKKYEISTTELYNPIKQDTKHGKLREYKWGDMLFNYGAFPQTWEDPDHLSPDTGAKGDNDPIDVVELGGRSWSTGSIVQVKVLGVLALIDDGETDWKVIAINVEDPLADLVNDVADVEAVLPGAIGALRKWLKLYKSVNGGKINVYAFDGECKHRDYAEAVIAETHDHWRRREGME